MTTVMTSMRKETKTAMTNLVVADMVEFTS